MAHFVGSSKKPYGSNHNSWLHGAPVAPSGVRLAVVLRPGDPARVLRWASRAAVPEAPGATGLGPLFGIPFLGWEIYGNLWWKWIGVIGAQLFVDGCINMYHLVQGLPFLTFFWIWGDMRLLWKRIYHDTFSISGFTHCAFVGDLPHWSPAISIRNWAENDAISHSS